jgi:hypothetical protein
VEGGDKGLVVRVKLKWAVLQVGAEVKEGGVRFSRWQQK